MYFTTMWRPSAIRCLEENGKVMHRTRVITAFLGRRCRSRNSLPAGDCPMERLFYW